jgi:UDP-3-O-[3-hydroxymyristoyl] N-acetylglucosamine deacetylase
MLHESAPKVERLKAEHLLFSYDGKGLTSGTKVKVEVYSASPGSGIRFIIPEAQNNNQNGWVEVAGNVDHVVSTFRNTVLGIGQSRLCIVEHFLAAAALWGADNLLVRVDGPELPLADGSAAIWVEQFEKSALPRKLITSSVEIPHAISVQEGDRQICAIPANRFTLTYMIDWQHPCIGKRWQTWSADHDYREIALARTFGTLNEHRLLGLDDQVVSLTSDGFTKPLLFEDEPVRHKLLDLLGDLALIGTNPLTLKAHVISIKGGHALDVAFAKQLRNLLA